MQQLDPMEWALARMHRRNELYGGAKRLIGEAAFQSCIASIENAVNETLQKEFGPKPAKEIRT